MMEPHLKLKKIRMVDDGGGSGLKFFRIVLF